MMPAPARLSAAALATWEACPRRYALAYRAKRYWPAADGPAPGVAAALDALSVGVDPEALGEEEEALTTAEGVGPLGLSEALAQAQRQRQGMWLGALVGSVLHTRIWAVSQGLKPLDFGLDPEALKGLSPEGQALARAQLESRWQAYLLSPEAHTPSDGSWHELKLEGAWEGLRLEVRFDRLALREGLWWVVDFKSGKAPKGKRLAQLKQSWQSRLYPFALVHLGAALGQGPIAPEQVRLRFLYLGDPEGPQAVDLAHDAQAQGATEKQLAFLAPQLNASFPNPEAPLAEWPFLDALEGQGSPSQWPADHVCLTCPYFALCHPLQPPQSPPPEAWGAAHFVWELDEGPAPGDAEAPGGAG